MTYLTDFIGQSSFLHILSMGEGVADISNRLNVGISFVMANDDP